MVPMAEYRGGAGGLGGGWMRVASALLSLSAEKLCRSRESRVLYQSSTALSELVFCRWLGLVVGGLNLIIFFEFMERKFLEQ